MDVEQTLRFILEQQTKTAALLFASEKRAERHEKRMDRQEKRMDGFDRRLEAIVRLLRELEAARQRAKKETDYTLNALINAQMRAEARLEKVEARQAKTDEKFERFIALLARQHGNGRNRR